MKMEQYQPSQIEKKWYDFWEENELFNPDKSSSDKTYSIVIPPPNVTGSLHNGHALVNSLQDVLVRHKRMAGFKTLWLPGTDHAGIATQMVVERELRKKGIEREELGREKFVEEIWKWKETSGNQIFKQLRSLGASLDWSRERFTLDEGLSKAVAKTFVDLYKEGLIYRGSYIVNWCPKDKTALSDLEVDAKETQGTFTHIGYPLEDGTGEIIVATTRPETMLGDTAVAVHPEDERYKHMIGKNLILPLVGRKIPIIADDYVDPEFGTGAVKITPAHDPNDFQMGKRHNLEEINIFNIDATINEIFPPLEGQDRFVARKNLVEMLKEGGFFKSQSPHMHAVGHCQRCATVIEPRVSVQWFCKMQDMAGEAMAAMNRGDITFFPGNQGKIFTEWMTNIQDWCLSRQIWWGHRIPAWYCNSCDAEIVSETTPTECPKCKAKDLREETDVLDTWFSSGLFPFSTMGWPEDTQDLKDFYPNSTLITGYDILFFWVARMVMMGIKLTGEVPFPHVFLHGLVRDENGDKMSKTKGNVIDPLVTIEEFGADALRFTLVRMTSGSRDIKLSNQVIEGNRNFINKIWNATRFALSHYDRLGAPKKISEVQPGIFDQWIIDKLDHATLEVSRYLDDYRFNEAAKQLYTFWWNEFCDWYVELVKPMLFGKLGTVAEEAALATLFYVIEEGLKILHPVMPFVTEELFSLLPTTEGSIMLQEYGYIKKSDCDQSQAEFIIELVSLARNIRGENNIKPNVKLNLTVVSVHGDLIGAAEAYEENIQALAGIKEVILLSSMTEPEGLASAVGKGFEIYMDLSEALDVKAETARLSKEQEKLTKKAKQLSGKLSNEGYLAKAPPAVIEKDKGELAEIEEKLSKLVENLNQLSKL